MPLFSGNVWKVCAQPTVVGRRDTVSPLEPAAQMALIGKPQRRRHIDGLIPTRQKLPRFGQPQLNEPGMRRQVELSLKAAGKREAIGAGLPGQIGQADIVAQMGIEIVPRPLRSATVTVIFYASGYGT